MESSSPAGEKRAANAAATTPNNTVATENTETAV